jgi:hypothetical protein
MNKQEKNYINNLYSFFYVFKMVNFESSSRSNKLLINTSFKREKLGKAKRIK